MVITLNGGSKNRRDASFVSSMQEGANRLELVIAAVIYCILAEQKQIKLIS